jgi:hypothetical protein
LAISLQETLNPRHKVSRSTLLFRKDKTLNWYQKENDSTRISSLQKSWNLNLHIGIAESFKWKHSILY